MVDDAIVMLENIVRHMEMGESRMLAAISASREIGFTILSMTISLVAVFIPILMMGGIVGRLFREFAITLSAAIGISLLVSLTTTPMMCAHLLRPEREITHGRVYEASERAFAWTVRQYDRTLTWVLRHPLPVLLILLVTVAVNAWLFVTVPKGWSVVR